MAGKSKSEAVPASLEINSFFTGEARENTEKVLFIFFGLSTLCGQFSLERHAL